MTVTNITNEAIEVAINQWGTGGGTEYYSIEPHETERWNRSDRRGFVMILKKEGKKVPFYIKANAEIKVSQISVSDNGEPLMPISLGI